MAAAEPRTLAAALSDQAQRTDRAWICSSLRRPIGNGMPIKKAAGAIASVVIRSFAGSGQVAAALTSGVAAKASAAIRTEMTPSTCMSRASLRAINDLLE